MKMDPVDIASRLGVPVAILALIFLFLVRTAKWFRPRADQLIDSHLSLLENMKRNGDTNTTNLAGLSRDVRELAEKSVCQFDPSQHCANFKPPHKGDQK